MGMVVGRLAGAGGNEEVDDALHQQHALRGHRLGKSGDDRSQGVDDGIEDLTLGHDHQDTPAMPTIRAPMAISLAPAMKSRAMPLGVVPPYDAAYQAPSPGTLPQYPAHPSRS